MDKRKYRLIKYLISTTALSIIAVTILVLFYFKALNGTAVSIEAMVGACIGGIIANSYLNKSEAIEADKHDQGKHKTD